VCCAVLSSAPCCSNLCAVLSLCCVVLSHALLTQAHAMVCAVLWCAQEDPKTILKVDLPLPKGQVFEHLAWGPDGTIAASSGGHIHFIDSATGQVCPGLGLCGSAFVRCLGGSFGGVQCLLTILVSRQ
jgi:hypothetical protein